MIIFGIYVLRYRARMAGESCKWLYTGNNRATSHAAQITKLYFFHQEN